MPTFSTGKASAIATVKLTNSSPATVLFRVVVGLDGQPVSASGEQAVAQNTDGLFPLVVRLPATPGTYRALVDVYARLDGQPVPTSPAGLYYGDEPVQIAFSVVEPGTSNGTPGWWISVQYPGAASFRVYLLDATKQQVAQWIMGTFPLPDSERPGALFLTRDAAQVAWYKAPGVMAQFQAAAVALEVYSTPDGAMRNGLWNGIYGQAGLMSPGAGLLATGLPVPFSGSPASSLQGALL